MVSVDDDRTSIWVKGDAAMLELDGTPQPECRLVAEKPLFRAVGNEPGWRLDVRADGLSLLLDNGDTHVFAPSPLVVDGDATRLAQVVINLLTNARDASPKGSRIIARAATHGPRVRFEVEDFGSGLPQGEIRAALFEPFVTTKDTGKGTGLGLALVVGGGV